jgi:hypothetical protein
VILDLARHLMNALGHNGTLYRNIQTIAFAQNRNGIKDTNYCYIKAILSTAVTGSKLSIWPSMSSSCTNGPSMDKADSHKTS